MDNDTNLDIAKATTAIARDAQQDSSSMITIAAVTMFFLPGTFISAIFSMVFFNVNMDEAGNEVFYVSKRWWYYIVVTVPLTLCVFVVWHVWRRFRMRRHFLANSKLLEDGGTQRTGKVDDPIELGVLGSATVLQPPRRAGATRFWRDFR